MGSINYILLLMAAVPAAAFAYKATNRLKRTPLADHVRGDAWMLVAALLAFAAYVVMATAKLGHAPTTQAAWVDLLIAASFASGIASFVYDARHGKRIFADVVSALLLELHPHLHATLEQVIAEAFPSPDIAHTYNHLSDQDLFDRHGDPRVSMERESESE